MDPTIEIAGLPARLKIAGEGFYATALFENVFINGSPLILYLDPPVATVGEVNAPGLLLGLLAALASGAIIR